MEQYTVADLIEMFAFPIGVGIWLIWMFVGSRGGNCYSHGRYRTKNCPGCAKERRSTAKEYDRNLERMRRQGRIKQ